MKAVTKSNFRKDFVHQLDHMEAMAFLDASQIVSFDGIHFTEVDNEAKFGYSLRDPKH